MDTETLNSIASAVTKGGPAVMLVLCWFAMKAVTTAKKAVDALESIQTTSQTMVPLVNTMAQNVADTKTMVGKIADKVDA